MRSSCSRWQWTSTMKRRCSRRSKSNRLILYELYYLHLTCNSLITNNISFSFRKFNALSTKTRQYLQEIFFLPVFAGEPAQVRKVWGHVQPHLSKWGIFFIYMMTLYSFYIKACLTLIVIERKFCNVVKIHCWGDFRDEDIHLIFLEEEKKLSQKKSNLFPQKPYLSQASVLHNLRSRYQAKLIYVS